MRIFLTGGTGFIGRHVVRALVDRGDECVVLSRSSANRWGDSAAVRLVRGDPTAPGQWQTEVSGTDVVVNLAGERIFNPLHRWTQERKELLSASRVSVTRNVVQAMRDAARSPRLLLSGSAIGYYGSRGDETLDESSAAGDDFLARLAVQWEEAALEGSDLAPVCLLRTGIVLGNDGGALPPLLTLFRTGLGGPWGSGKQWWSWIHIADQLRIILTALDRGLAGPINLTAPQPVTVNEFARELGKALRRPAFLRAPESALRAVLGEGATALFDLQRVVPARANAEGYEFEFPGVAEALRNLIAG
jgi:uncharacterized protein (TIGR01777 family)